MFDIKTMASIKAALLFLVIGSSTMYRLTQQLLGKLFTVSVYGCPTTSGLLLHAVVIGLLTYSLMGVFVELFEDQKKDDKKKEEDVKMHPLLKRVNNVVNAATQN
jgi:hypothetical protein